MRCSLPVGDMTWAGYEEKGGIFRCTYCKMLEGKTEEGKEYEAMLTQRRKTFNGITGAFPVLISQLASCTVSPVASGQRALLGNEVLRYQVDRPRSILLVARNVQHCL